jgi:hypothetical protein
MELENLLVVIFGNGHNFYKMGRITYSAVVLDKKSRSRLLEYMSHYIPNHFEVIAHHMTINMGELKPEMKDRIGEQVTLKVVSVGISDMALAVGVEGFPSKNAIPHVTVAINRKEGAKPFMSNKITNWQPVQFALDLTGVVTEVPW